MEYNFFFQVFVFLLGTVIMVPVARFFKLGSVLGYLLAGILIGPSVLDLIAYEGHTVMEAAEFGVVMMLFVIGLELEPNKMWRMRKSILGLGGAQLLVTTALILCIAMGLGFDWKVGLILGFVMATSSTAMVMQIFSEKGWKDTSAGTNGFSVLLLQDMAVIPIMAIIPLLSDVPMEHHTDTPSFFSDLSSMGQTLLLIGSVLAVILMGRYVLYPLFRLVAKFRLREVFTATVLLLVVGVGLLMDMVGLSPALGAFLSGVLLANSEYRHEIETAIDPFKGLLLGLFFIAVGTLIDFGLIYENPLLIIGLVVSILVLKGMVIFFLGKLFNMSNSQNFLFSTGLSQIGGFGFVLLSISYATGALSRYITDILMVVVAITMATTPFIMLLSERMVKYWFCPVQIEEKPSGHDIKPEANKVIIAGFGQFGNIIGRFLNAHDVGVTILDNDSDRVDFFRKIGIKIYYGDASRHDLLEIAGAKDAEVIIVALGDRAKRMEVIEMVKKHFPHLYILARSENRYDAYDQMNAGIMHIYRETLDTSLRLGTDVLKILGFDENQAKKAANTFLSHDEQTLKHLSSIRNDQEYIKAARDVVNELEVIIKADSQVYAKASN